MISPVTKVAELEQILSWSTFQIHSKVQLFILSPHQLLCSVYRVNNLRILLVEVSEDMDTNLLPFLLFLALQLYSRIRLSFQFLFLFSFRLPCYTVEQHWLNT